VALPLTAKRLVAEVREEVADVGSLVWTDEQVLRAADKALRPIWTEGRLAFQDHELDRFEIPVSDLLLTAQRWYEYGLPETVGVVRLVQGVVQPGVPAVNIEPIPLDFQEEGRSHSLSSAPLYAFSRWGRPGNLSIYGNLGRITTIRVWYVRHWPPLHFGVSTVQIAPSSNSFQLSPSPTGQIVFRDDLYVGMDLEIESHSDGLAVWRDVLRRVAIYTNNFGGSGLFGVVGVTPDFPATLAAGKTISYSLCVPLEAEHHDLLVVETAARLLERAGDQVALTSMQARRAQMWSLFRSGMSARRALAPKEIWNSR
jgi:hypothetical protein